MASRALSRGQSGGIVGRMQGTRRPKDDSDSELGQTEAPRTLNPEP